MPLEVWDARTDIRNLFISPEIRSRIMRFDAGQVSAGHTHDLGHEMFLVLEGQAEFTIAGQSAVLGPGQACVARAGEWHEIRALEDAPMTLYLSVTPHVEPTHTQWDREGGDRLPYHYGAATRLDRVAPFDPPDVLLDRHLAASDRLASAAADNAASQLNASSALRSALAAGDAAKAHDALDEMWAAMRSLHEVLRSSELEWNELAAAAGRD
jgi:quercetin dioxygenase-like cupin family protein